MTIAQADAEQRIVDDLSSLVGACPIILAGSRATGDAAPDSDYDVYVVMSALAAVRRMRGLRSIGADLAARIGAPVSVNPLPAFRLKRPGPTLIVWKLRREGKVLNPPSFRLDTTRAPAGDDRAISSYALSGLRYLVEDLDPASLGNLQLAPTTAARVRKALRHAAQIELLAVDRYEPSLVGALAALPDPIATRLGSLAIEADRSASWFAVRDCLISRSTHRPDSLRRRFVVNAQYVVLRALRTRKMRLNAVSRSRSVSEQLALALVELALALESDGSVNNDRLRAANAALPEPCAEAALSWTEVRDRVDDSWSDANPLVGF